MSLSVTVTSYPGKNTLNGLLGVTVTSALPSPTASFSTAVNVTSWYWPEVSSVHVSVVGETVNTSVSLLANVSTTVPSPCLRINLILKASVAPSRMVSGSGSLSIATAKNSLVMPMYSAPEAVSVTVVRR